MTCDSTRGEWSTPTRESRCPDCNAVMPVDKGPMTTWMADRNRDAKRSAFAQLADSKALRVKNQPRVRRAAFCLFGRGTPKEAA